MTISDSSQASMSPKQAPASDPPPPWQFSWKRVLIVLGIPAGMGLLAFLVGYFEISFVRCAFRHFTGLHCPGCGGTRMIHSLMDMRFQDALIFNGLVMVMTPILAYFYLAWGWYYSFNQKWWGYGLMARYWWLILVISFAYAIVRNLPFWPSMPYGG